MRRPRHHAPPDRRASRLYVSVYTMSGWFCCGSVILPRLATERQVRGALRGVRLELPSLISVDWHTQYIGMVYDETPGMRGLLVRLTESQLP